MNFKVLIDVEKKIALLLVIREKQNNPYLLLLERASLHFCRHDWFRVRKGKHAKV